VSGKSGGLTVTEEKRGAGIFGEGTMVRRKGTIQSGRKTGVVTRERDKTLLVSTQEGEKGREGFKILRVALEMEPLGSLMRKTLNEKCCPSEKGKPRNRKTLLETRRIAGIQG